MGEINLTIGPSSDELLAQLERGRSVEKRIAAAKELGLAPVTNERIIRALLQTRANLENLLPDLAQAADEAFHSAASQQFLADHPNLETEIKDQAKNLTSKSEKAGKLIGVGIVSLIPPCLAVLFFRGNLPVLVGAVFLGIVFGVWLYRNMKIPDSATVIALGEQNRQARQIRQQIRASLKRNQIRAKVFFEIKCENVLGAPVPQIGNPYGDEFTCRCEEDANTVVRLKFEGFYHGMYGNVAGIPCYRMMCHVTVLDKDLKEIDSRSFWGSEAPDHITYEPTHRPERVALGFSLAGVQQIEAYLSSFQVVVVDIQ